MVRIAHDREACIGCGACIAIHPKGWKMGNDGKTDIIGSTRREDGREEKEATGEDFDLHKEAAESCPVACIHLTDDEGEKAT